MKCALLFLILACCFAIPAPIHAFARHEHLHRRIRLHRVSPSIFTQYPELEGSMGVRILENSLADRDRFERIKDVKQIHVFADAGILVAVPENGIGFFLDEKLPLYRRYLRREALDFLKMFAADHWNEFHTFLKIDSLVRSAEDQRIISRHDVNAVQDRDVPSLHLTGCAFDVSAKDMSYDETRWVAKYLATSSRLSHGTIWPTYEYKASVNFHVVVFPGIH